VDLYFNCGTRSYRWLVVVELRACRTAATSFTASSRPKKAQNAAAEARGGTTRRGRVRQTRRVRAQPVAIYQGVDRWQLLFQKGQLPCGGPAVREGDQVGSGLGRSIPEARRGRREVERSRRRARSLHEIPCPGPGRKERRRNQEKAHKVAGREEVSESFVPCSTWRNPPVLLLRLT
jgi:hypothetical protein